MRVAACGNKRLQRFNAAAAMQQDAFARGHLVKRHPAARRLHERGGGGGLELMYLEPARALHLVLDTLENGSVAGPVGRAGECAADFRVLAPVHPGSGTWADGA